jgi:signal transduction histidine kinase
MKFTHLCLSASLLAPGVSGQEAPGLERLAFWSWGATAQLKDELKVIDKELAKLPELAVISSSQKVGFKTGVTTRENVRWLAVELAGEAVADTVVLAPVLAKAATGVVAGYGFPVRFVLEVFDAGGQATVVLDASREDFPNPGCFPVVARFQPRRTKRVRLTVIKPWSLDGADTLALAELLILSGNRNLAAGAKVTSSSSRAAPRTWTRTGLVDWITPLGLPVRPEPTGAPGFHSAVSQTAEETKHVTVSLREPMPIDEVLVVPARVKEVPLWFDYGFPHLYKVEGALNKDFSDAILLGECTDRFEPRPGMNLVGFPVGGRKIQHVRFTAIRLWFRQNDYVFALAELALMRDGVNVALGAEVTASDQCAAASGMNWAPQQLTDGLTAEGPLIPLPVWFSQLERRRSLERNRSGLVQRIDDHLRGARQQVVNASISGLGAASLISVLLLVRQRQQRRRDAQRLQEKLARDLHDEIGSNLGSIAVISSLANEPNTTPESLRTDLAEIGQVAAESADSMRDLVQLINPRTHAPESHWLDVIHRLIERLLRGIETTCEFPAHPLQLEPDVETRREIYLLCKEALHNIARHARASKASVRIAPSEKGLQVRITDNGVGFDFASRSTGHGIGNMQERASMMGAQLHLASKPGAGTTVQFDVPATKRWCRS